jgi:hypothetical protein
VPQTTRPTQTPVNPGIAPRGRGYQVPETPLSASGLANINAGVVRESFQNAATGAAPWPEAVSLEEIKVAYPGWSKEKEVQSMTAAGYMWNPTAGEYQYAWTGQPASVAGGEPAQQGSPGSGPYPGQTNRPGGAWQLRYNRRGELVWKLNKSRGAWEREDRNRPAAAPPAINGPAGSYGLVWRVNT